IYTLTTVISTLSLHDALPILRAKAAIEEVAKDRENIVITEIPYQVNKATLIKRIAELAQNKKIEGISDVRDESDREGMRIVVELDRKSTRLNSSHDQISYAVF